MVLSIKGIDHKNLKEKYGYSIIVKQERVVCENNILRNRKIIKKVKEKELIYRAQILKYSSLFYKDFYYVFEGDIVRYIL